MTTGPRIYNLFPRLCGTVKDWERLLPSIVRMRFDWLFVNPLHRPGGSGSLYAVADYYRWNPLFAPEDEEGDGWIRHFNWICGERGLSVMMDLVINHTANDSALVEEHPDWYLRDDDGRPRAPGCVEEDGTVVTWGDLAELDYDSPQSRAELIDYWCDFIRHCVGLGFRGFRCDAAYQVPAEVWRAVIEAAEAVRPDVVFAAETLGCTPEEVEALRPAGFSYLFNSSAWWDFEAAYLLDQYEAFRGFAPSIAFPESHDTDRLANTLRAAGNDSPESIERAYRSRYLFAAAFSTGVMMPVGYEHGFRRRLNVVETVPEDWEEPAFDLGEFIAGVHRMKESAPALNEEGPQRRIDAEGSVTALLRETGDGRAWALTLINRDTAAAAEARLDLTDADLSRGVEITPGSDAAPIPVDGPITVAAGDVRIFAGEAAA